MTVVAVGSTRADRVFAVSPDMRVKDRLRRWRQKRAHERYEQEREQREARQRVDAEEAVRNVSRWGGPWA
jgi:hypothetical protein